ncbi:MAG: hydrogenase expression/formation protein HypE [Thermoplasmata archaeon]|nr:MAG: hydrogenase expression/formation protein HypE [Thermoplasmata archaeon]
MSDIVKRSHGAGGEDMEWFIRNYVLKNLGGKVGDVPLEALDDSAIIGDVVFTIDSHTVKPLFFPGGDIGRLAVCGTVNDIAVMGATPIALSLALVVEEGLPLSTVDRVLQSVALAANEARVPVVTGDTKVVEQGGVDEMVVTTSAFGVRSKYLDRNIETIREFRDFENQWITDSTLAKGDVIIVSGTIGDHGIALMAHREGYGFEGELKSDIAPLNNLVEDLLAVGGITAMKDPTRGGLATVLNEWADKSGVGIRVYEEKIPVREDVRAVAEMLGIDPLEVGNEGKIVIGCVKEMAEDVLAELKRHELGKNSCIIGEVADDVEARYVVMRTSVGGDRVIERPVADPVPRIC